MSSRGVPRDSPGPSLRGRLCGLGLVFVLAGCAARTAPPAGAPERARAASTYSASVRVSLKSPTLRGRARALVAFSRPGALRLELPGPTGALCIAVARGEDMVAVFPGERAVWHGAATADQMEALLGVRLSPSELMDLLTGTPAGRLLDFRVRWGDQLPRRLDATLEDATRIEVVVESADLDPPLPAAAFEPPRSAGYRVVEAKEARRLMGIR